MFSERSEKNPMITWLAFEDALCGRPVRKVMCTRVDGADPTTIGFVDPDELDAQRITYLTAASAGGATRNNKVYIDTTFDLALSGKTRRQYFLLLVRIEGTRQCVRQGVAQGAAA